MNRPDSNPIQEIVVLLYDVIVIGGGASGIVAAVSAAEMNAHVLLLEKNDQIGRKILASGNGRCNILNRGHLKYYGDSHFAESVISACSCEELAAFFHHYGLALTEENEGRVYPFSKLSATVLNTLKTALQMNHVQLCFRSNVVSVIEHSSVFSVLLENGSSYSSKAVIISCGGMAQPKLGGCPSGYDLLTSFGHRRTEVFPSLVPIRTDPLSVSGLSGLRASCQVSVLENDRVLHCEQGEVLFTDYGISGICVMQCSRFVHGRKSMIELNFLHNLFADSSSLLQELQRRKQLFSGLSPLSLLEGILSSRISYAVLKQAGIPLRGECCGQLSKADLIRITQTAFHYRVIVLGTKGFEFAQVTAGGIDCSDFDDSSMESLLVPRLYAAGEVLDVDGDCGGFNLMFAFASGRVAGQSAATGTLSGR